MFSVIFVLADCWASFLQVEELLSDVVRRVVVAAAFSRLVGAQAIVRSGDRVVSSIAYAEPHTEAELRAWAERNGLPARRMAEPTPVEAAPPRRRHAHVPPDGVSHSPGV